MGPVCVEFRETIYLPEILVNPNLETATVELDVKAINYSETARSVVLKAKVLPFESKYYQPPVPGKEVEIILGQVMCPPGESQHKFAIKLENPVLWDIKCPFLYHLRITGDGKLLGQTRFGFRKFEVKDKKFLLNGNTVYMLGCNPAGGYQNYSPRLNAFNKANWLRYYLKLYKEMNMSFLRVHNGPATRIFYDICDELGIITEDDFSPDFKNLRSEEITRPELLAEAKVEGYLTKDGFTPEFKKVLSKWLVRLHNHPSVCMFTGGNELGLFNQVHTEEQITEYFNNFYAFVKMHDRQQRPVTASSGMVLFTGWSTTLKLDYYDYHSYSNHGSGPANLINEEKSAYNRLERVYGKIDKPVINGETGGYQAASVLRPVVQQWWSQGVLDKKKYVQWINERDMSKSLMYWYYLQQTLYIAVKGVRSVVTPETMQKATAEMRQEMVQILRRDIDFLQGFMFHDISPTHFGLNSSDPTLTENQIQELYQKCHESVEFLSLREACAQQFVTLDMYDRHLFAGEQFQTTVFVINNLYHTHENNLTVKLFLEDEKGKPIHTEELIFREIPEDSKSKKEVAFPLPENLPTGDYTIRLRLIKGEKVINEQAFPLFVLGKMERKPVISTTKKIALYDQANEMFGSDVGSTKFVLDRLGIRYVRLDNPENLDAYDVLIIGSKSFDITLIKAWERIRQWL